MDRYDAVEVSPGEWIVHRERADGVNMEASIRMPVGAKEDQAIEAAVRQGSWDR
jgi:hypothetical protein